MHHRGPLPGEGQRQSPHAGQGQGQNQGLAGGHVRAPEHPVRAVTSAMYQFSHLEMGVVTAPASQGCWADSEQHLGPSCRDTLGTCQSRICCSLSCCGCSLCGLWKDGFVHRDSRIEEGNVEQRGQELYKQPYYMQYQVSYGTVPKDSQS